MKTKKFNKFAWNKQTISNLNTEKLNSINGGTGFTKTIANSMFCFQTNITNIRVQTMTGTTKSGYICKDSDNCPPETSDCPTAHTTCTSHMPTGANSGLVCR